MGETMNKKIETIYAVSVLFNNEQKKVEAFLKILNELADQKNKLEKELKNEIFWLRTKTSILEKEIDKLKNKENKNG